MRKCDGCDRECSGGFVQRLCNDGASVTLCSCCERELQYCDRLLASPLQLCVMPPVGVRAMTVLSSHGGIKGVIKRQEKVGLPWD